MRRCFALAVGFAVLTATLRQAMAQAASLPSEAVQSAPSASANDPTVAAPPADAASGAWPALKVPETRSLAELAKFVAEVKALQPTTEAHYLEMQKAVLEASKRILEGTKDRTTQEYRLAEFDYISSSVMLLGNDGPEAQKKTFERFRDYLKAKTKPDDNDLRMVLLTGQNLEQIADGQLAREAYREFAKILRDKKSEAFQVWIALLDANARRVELPGKEMAVTGKSITGEDFDIQSCRGKLTLVYFWASWEASCKQEFPYVRKLYLEYRDRGFEIVAISVDDDREKLVNFIRQNEVPWINLWDEENRSSPVAVQQYGISAIPTMILLDREGKVISLEARGLILGRLLEKHIGNPAQTPADTSRQSPSPAK